MIYNLNNPFEVEQFKTRAEALSKNGGFVEMTKKKPPRTDNQNKYAHLIIGYLATMTGSTLEEVKRLVFKIECNRELFVITKHSELLGKDIQTLRSTTELTQDEMSLAIERFRNWSADKGYYLPSSEEGEYLQYVEQQINNNRQYL